MRTFKEYVNESISQEELKKKNVFFDFDIKKGYNVPQKVVSLLHNKVVGAADWKARASVADNAYLGEPSSSDEKDIEKISLKSGEMIFRYATGNSSVSGIAPFIKINVLKGLAYFLTEDSSNGNIDEVQFETKPTKLKYLHIDPKYMKKLGVV